MTQKDITLIHWDIHHWEGYLYKKLKNNMDITDNLNFENS